MSTATVAAMRSSTASVLLGGTAHRSSAISLATRTCGVLRKATTDRSRPSWLDSSRRRFCDGGAPPPPATGGIHSPPEREEDRFVVTGSLLDARRAGSDSPVPGQFLSLSHAFGAEAVAAFAAHAGDNNPIHLDKEYARQAGYVLESTA